MINRTTEKKVVGDKRFYNEVYEVNVQDESKTILHSLTPLANIKTSPLVL